MAKTSLLEKVSIINSALRTMLGTALLGGLGFGGWYGYNVYNATEIEAQRAVKELASARADLSEAQLALDQKDGVIHEQENAIGNLETEVAEQQEQIERIETAKRLLKVDQRIASLTVLSQEKDDEGKVLESDIEFQELNNNGDPLDKPRRFTIAGDIVYIDTWVVKFNDEYIEQADLLRGTSLVLFRRIFGEQQRPQDGFVLDEKGARPAAYADGSELSEFERKIWGDFWAVADDETKRKDLGIRAMHGEAPSRPVKEGVRYRIERRASAGLEFEIDGEAPQPPKPAA
jgi:hypothetical protein